MLIIAIPKSASTSLMRTLAKIHDLPCDMHFKWNGPLSKEFPNFHLQHSFGWELNEETVSYFINSEIIFKSHIVPSLNNLNLLCDHKKVILLRKPEGIIGAYRVQSRLVA